MGCLRSETQGTPHLSQGTPFVRGRNTLAGARGRGARSAAGGMESPSPSSSRAQASGSKTSKGTGRSRSVPRTIRSITPSEFKALRTQQVGLNCVRSGLPRPRTTGLWPGGDRHAVSSKFTRSGPRQALPLPFLRRTSWLHLLCAAVCVLLSRAAGGGTSPACLGEALSIGACFCAVLQVTVGLFSLCRACCLGSYPNCSK